MNLEYQFHDKRLVPRDGQTRWKVQHNAATEASKPLSSSQRLPMFRSPDRIMELRDGIFRAVIEFVELWFTF